MPTLRFKYSGLTLPLFLLYCCAAFSADAVAQAASASGGFRIAGKVVSSNTGALLSRTRVTIASVQNRGETNSVITGDDGVFEFNHLAPGKYSLECARRGFITSYFDQHDRYSTAIVTGGEVDSEHLVFQLTPQGIITGKILDESGEPVRDAGVSLYRQDHGGGLSTIGKIGAAQTDDRGTYEFANLSLGNYFVSVNAKPWYAQRQGSARNEDGSWTHSAADPSLDVAYPTTYYSGVTDSDEATPIPLHGGEHLAVDIHLTAVPALRIVYRRPSGSGNGFGMPVLLKREFDSTENITEMLFTRPGTPIDGSGPPPFMMLSENEIEFSGIPAGKYTVLMPDSSGGPREGAIAEVDLSKDGQVLEPSSGEPVSSVKLAVRVAGEVHLPLPIVVALINPEQHKTVSSAPVDANGEVELIGIPPGRYILVSATSTGDYYVRGVDTNGSHSVSNLLDVPAGSTVEGTILLMAGRSRVEGFAKRNGKGTASAMIVLVPKDPDTNRVLFRRDQSDSDGSFSLQSVIPGDYTIVAIENGWDLDWSQPGVIAHYVEHGRKIVVPTGSQGPVHLSEAVEVQPR